MDVLQRRIDMQSAPQVGHDQLPGYTVAYERGEIRFPVYVVAFIAACLATIGAATDNIILIAIALLAFGYAYHNYPLLEVGRPRIGAGQYGVFAEGLGIISWRAIKAIDLMPVDMRGARSNELRITLGAPLDRALLADWRKRPLHRLLMRLPWAMSGADIVRVPLDVFDQPAEDIFSNVTRMMKFYRR
jgi:hypothetical protein